ncbi:MAG: PRTRC system protein A [Pseudomonadota bacterium]
MNRFDQALQQSFPSVMVPMREPLAPLVKPGERLVIAANGVFLEIVRPWIRLVRRIAEYRVATAIPYGTYDEVTERRCGAVAPELIAAFYRQTREALPNETGAWIVWHAETGEFRLVPLTPIEHSPGHLVYERPVLSAEEHLVVDCHSHGASSAYFSRTDNGDDRHDVKFALVLGNCDREPSTALRLCAKGVFEKFEQLPAPWVASLAAEVQS